MDSKLDLGPIETVALTKLSTDTDNLGRQINKNKKSVYTKGLNDLDKIRIRFWKEIKSINNSYSKSPDEGKKTAAATMHMFISPYWDTEHLPLNSRTTVFSEIIDKYKNSPELISAAGIMGIDSSFASLEVKNVATHAVYKTRNDEYAKNEVSGTLLKPIAVNSYNVYCTAMEQAANLTPNESIISLFNKLNELRKKYHALGNGGTNSPKPDLTSGI